VKTWFLPYHVAPLWNRASKR